MHVGRRNLLRHRIAFQCADGSWEYYIRSMVRETRQCVSMTRVSLEHLVPDYRGEYLDSAFFLDRGFVVIDHHDIGLVDRAPSTRLD